MSCIALAQEKVPFCKMFGVAQQGCVLALTGKATDAIQAISCRDCRVARNRGNDIWSHFLSHLAWAYADAWATR